MNFKLASVKYFSKLTHHFRKDEVSSITFIKHWMIAPNTIESRIYQERIVQTCFQKNTLVILPTALGKTIIALLTAVKRLDIYPWAKVVFLAPTRPLVIQHFNTFKDLLIYDQRKFQILTGRNPPQQRTRLWENSQFIFATPQVIKNDLLNQRYNLKEVALIIFDEAHHARKKYAYNLIARQYLEINSDPVILGLTASPGKDMAHIAELCRNLFIEAIEYRTEEDADVKNYINPIQMNWHKVELPQEYKQIKSTIEEILQDKLMKLRQMRLLSLKPLNYITKMDLINLGNKLRRHLQNKEITNKGYIFTGIIFQAAAISLMHAAELIATQEISVFQNFLNKIEDDALREETKFAQIIVKDERFQTLLLMCEYYQDILHPKMKKLKQLIQEELAKKPNARIIIFTQYRDTALKIIDVLRNIPHVKAARFIGQAHKRNDPGLSQKQQAEIIDDFRFGQFNTLVATCIAEEGLDIPTVDLVIFYEPIPSEIRYIQRRGRTGRRTVGKVDILITQNTVDEAFHYAALTREKKMKNIIKKLNTELTLRIQRKKLESPIEKEKIQATIEKKKIQATSNTKSSRPKIPIPKPSSQIHQKYDIKNIIISNTKGLYHTIRWVFTNLKNLDQGTGISVEKIVSLAKNEDLKVELVLMAITRMIYEGQIYQPKPNIIALVK